MELHLKGPYHGCYQEQHIARRKDHQELNYPFKGRKNFAGPRRHLFAPRFAFLTRENKSAIAFEANAT
jgi:hypothetical protein